MRWQRWRPARVGTTRPRRWRCSGLPPNASRLTSQLGPGAAFPARAAHASRTCSNERPPAPCHWARRLSSSVSKRRSMACSDVFTASNLSAVLAMTAASAWVIAIGDSHPLLRSAPIFAPNAIDVCHWMARPKCKLWKTPGKSGRRSHIARHQPSTTAARLSSTPCGTRLSTCARHRHRPSAGQTETGERIRAFHRVRDTVDDQLHRARRHIGLHQCRFAVRHGHAYPRSFCVSDDVQRAAVVDRAQRSGRRRRSAATYVRDYWNGSKQGRRTARRAEAHHAEYGAC